MHEPQIGQLLGRYRIDALLGEGGMAMVYRAVDPTTGRDVALKVVHPSLVRDPAFVARFLREAKVVGRLQHPHILPLYDTGEQDDLPYLVMPYVAGGTLEDWLAGKHTHTELLTLVRPIAAALDYAHDRGVIHRDVKPGNVLIGADGVPLLADFGIAHAIGDSKLTATGMHIGSALYMAPEQAQGLPLTGSADQYALGSMLYEALTGRPPYTMAHADTSFSLMLRKLAQAPPPPSSLNPALSPACDVILLRALAKEPERRFATCVALVDALADALANPWVPPSKVTAPPSPPPLTPMPPPQYPGAATAPPARKGRSSWWMVLGVGLALLLCLTLSVAVVAWRVANRNAPTISDSGRTTATAPRIATRTAARSAGAQQGAGISNLATAEELTNGSRPNRKTDQFRVGEEVYITYTASRVEDGQFVDLKIIRENGSVAYTDRNTFEQEEDYDGYFLFTPNAAGSYRVELSFNGNSSLSQTVKFTVR
jgi:serine/threonine-protein kinase